MVTDKPKGKEVNRLYGTQNCPYTQRLKIIMKAKEINAHFIDLEPNNLPSEVKEMTPYNELPVYLDSNIILFEPDVIFEYLESRFPHPSLLPATPKDRAAVRMLSKELDDNWLPLLVTALNHPNQKVTALKQLVMLLFQSIKLFQNSKYLTGDKLSYTDITMSIILFNLDALGFEIPERFEHLRNYFERLHHHENILAVFSKTEFA